MSRKNGTCGIYINISEELNDKLDILCERESRKKNDQVTHLIKLATENMEVPVKMKPAKKSKS